MARLLRVSLGAWLLQVRLALWWAVGSRGSPLVPWPSRRQQGPWQAVRGAAGLSPHSGGEGAERALGEDAGAPSGLLC